MDVVTCGNTGWTTLILIPERDIEETIPSFVAAAVRRDIATEMSLSMNPARGLRSFIKYLYPDISKRSSTSGIRNELPPARAADPKATSNKCACESIALCIIRYITFAFRSIANILS